MKVSLWLMELPVSLLVLLVNYSAELFERILRIVFLLGY